MLFSKKKLNTIMFAISKQCNLSCKYCYVPKENKVVHIDENDIFNNVKLFFEKIRHENYGLKKIIFHGAEPTLISTHTYNKIKELHSSMFNEPIEWWIQSNGMNLDTFILTIDKEFNFSISLDCFKENHDYFRGKNTFDTIKSNIMLAKKNGFLVSIISVLNQNIINNKDKLLDFMRFCEDNNLFLTLQPIHDYDNIANYKHDYYEFGKWLYENEVFYHYQSFMKSICCNFGNNCFVFEFDYNGDVYTCNKQYSQKKSFANWKEHSLDDIINKRKNYFNKELLNKECLQCSYFKYCNGGCPNDRVNGLALDCDIRKGFYETLIENEENIDSVLDIRDLLINNRTK